VDGPSPDVDRKRVPQRGTRSERGPTRSTETMFIEIMTHDKSIGTAPVDTSNLTLNSSRTVVAPFSKLNPPGFVNIF
jgi:hypothetical protein